MTEEEAVEAEMARIYDKSGAWWFPSDSEFSQLRDEAIKNLTNN